MSLSVYRCNHYTNRLIDEATAELRSERDSLRAENELLRKRPMCDHLELEKIAAKIQAERDAAEAKLAAVEALCVSEENAPGRGVMFSGSKFPAMIHTGSVRAALGLDREVADNRSNQ